MPLNISNFDPIGDQRPQSAPLISKYDVVYDLCATQCCVIREPDSTRRLIKNPIQKDLINSTRLEQSKITLLFRTQVIKMNELTGLGCFHPILMKTEPSLGAYIALLTPDKSSSTS